MKKYTGSIISLAGKIIDDAVAHGSRTIQLRPDLPMLILADNGKDFDTIGIIHPRMRTAIVSRFKMQANLLIREHRKVQIGTIATRVGRSPRIVRVVVIPGVQGEHIILDFCYSA
jgi:type II secretory ATPase GspE/PulE/Tfp pilus assembly ATPase PilB-like protein